MQLDIQMGDDFEARRRRKTQFSDDIFKLNGGKIIRQRRENSKGSSHTRIPKQAEKRKTVRILFSWKINWWKVEYLLFKKKILFRIDELMFLIFNYRNVLMVDWIWNHWLLFLASSTVEMDCVFC
jgi:hypothetical protein